jgi:lantibiotic modifying enzyme
MRAYSQVQVPWIERTREIANTIACAALPGRNGGIVWSDSSSADSKALGPHLYNGQTGIALLFAALHAEPGGEEQQYRDVSLGAIALLRRQLRKIVSDPELAARTNFRLGAMIGLGGYIYGFTKIGIWLDEPLLLDEAAALAELITPERIAADRALDVAHGSAGALLALLSLRSATSPAGPAGESLLERARACGDHLLERRSPEGAARAWPSEDGGPLCGFAHGAAGISYALVRLHEETREPRYLDAAREGIAFERANFDPARGNWRDLRSPAPVRDLIGWCHGAPGIVLSRLGMLRTLDDAEIHREIADGLETTSSSQIEGPDHLCCGNMARAATLLYAHRSLGEERLLSRAEEIATATLQRAAAREAKGGGSRPDPTLFSGSAGVAWTLLGLAHPERHSCVLLLE